MCHGLSEVGRPWTPSWVPMICKMERTFWTIAPKPFALFQRLNILQIAECLRKILSLLGDMGGAYSLHNSRFRNFLQKRRVPPEPLSRLINPIIPIRMLQPGCVQIAHEHTFLGSHQDQFSRHIWLRKCVRRVKNRARRTRFLHLPRVNGKNTYLGSMNRLCSVPSCHTTYPTPMG